MKPIHLFNVVPSLPQPLEGLRELAYNLRWAWNHDAIELFRRLDSDLWEASGHNPVRMLGSIDQEVLKSAAEDEAFKAHLNRVTWDTDEYLHSETTWFQTAHGRSAGPLAAYFCAEFGLTECLSIFAGGLGILAGDHLKSASDLGVPLVGVGLLYQQGYFRQYLNQSGWQQEAYEDNDFSVLPLALLKAGDGKPLAVFVDLPGRSVKAQVWLVRVGRVSLYLLDTNVPENRPEDRDITDQLYGGDREMRIQQEILLGIGGYRLLETLGLEPAVYHINEGHSAFLALERVRRIRERHGLSFAEAREMASAGLVFTTHTPVPAGHDYFAPDLMERYFAGYARGLGISWPEFLALGRQDPNDQNEAFCMTVLALRLAACSNGVSRLHGQVSREMWRRIWPGVPFEEIPIGHVTNGVHLRSWISLEMNQVYDRYLGPGWHERGSDRRLWERAARIPPEELWRTHERRRERLVAFARRRLREQFLRRGASPAELNLAAEALDPEALTIGFARRFATYKRAGLLLRDVDRLERILNNPDRPVQVIFAGKAHPLDSGGKDLIRKVIELAERPAFRRRIVFLEDYDMAVARYLVQGVDVWLNTPLRPQEASGTSGMKAAANGGLNLSILDGWWDEAWRDHPEGEPIGWAIGAGETYENREYQDDVESRALYQTLEADVVPAFYDRGPDRLPRRWITRMKSSIGSLCYLFSAQRMMREYTERIYLKAREQAAEMAAGNAARARSLAAWKQRVRENWPHVRVEDAEACAPPEVGVSENFSSRVWVRLGALSSEDVAVELYIGRVNARGELVEARSFPMKAAASGQDGRHLFEAQGVQCPQSGLHGCTVRVLPRHPDLRTPFLPGLITWAGQA
ncbi:MAG: alpha-glucan family phosphorylase [Bryobacterales bacterium]|nr:alpha-glucan family phosphorylase [Bryobacterales bacterium]